MVKSELVSIYKEHLHFGRQIFLLAKNELIKTYKGAVIGPLWSVVKPLFTIFVYWFAFQLGVRGNGNVPVELGGQTVEFDRFLFMIVGFIPWFFINESILSGAKSIRMNRHFVTKVSFPVSTIMTYTLLSKLFVHLLLSLLMYVYVIFQGGGVSLYNLQFFLYCPLMFVFFLALSWSTAPMSAFSMDFQNVIISIMAGIFWLSGIVYNSYDMPYEWLNKVMLFNPINFFVNGYRNTFIYNQWFFERPLEVIIFLGEFLLIFILGNFNYKRLRKRMADVL